jgi:hypothetical protein
VDPHTQFLEHCIGDKEISQKWYEVQGISLVSLWLCFLNGFSMEFCLALLVFSMESDTCRIILLYPALCELVRNSKSDSKGIYTRVS